MSVTEILKAVGWGLDALVAWAEKKGRRGESTEVAKQAGADVGTCVHDQCECILTGADFDRSRYGTQVLLDAARSVVAFHDWVHASHLVVRATELGLVHPDWGYGGTLDVWADLAGVPAIIDLKTTKSVYPKHVLQVAAYARLVEWHYPVTIQQGVVVRLGGNGGIEVVTVGAHELDTAFGLFIRAKELAEAEGMVQQWIRDGRW